MHAGDLYKASGSMRSSSKRGESFRANSSSMWRNTGLEVFARSSREEDDEEALKWAALEKLPTFDRLRKGLLLGSRGANEIEVNDLGLHDKKQLIERLVQTFSYKLLLTYMQRISRTLQGWDRHSDYRSEEVRYEHLNIDASAFSASRALPTFVNFHKDLQWA